jgi:hypothetical protein
MESTLYYGGGWLAPRESWSFSGEAADWLSRSQCIVLQISNSVQAFVLTFDEKLSLAFDEGILASGWETVVNGRLRVVESPLVEAFVLLELPPAEYAEFGAGVGLH